MVLFDPSFERLPVAEIADEGDDFLSTKPDDFRVMILKDDGTVAQGFEFLRVMDGEFMFGIDVREIEFRSSANACVYLADLIDLALGAAAQA